MKTKCPNLLIIGAMKSGTTSLHNYLDEHPEIYMSNLKEPGYFVEEINYSKGRDWYTSLFDAVDNEIICGESTTDYTKLPTYQGVVKKIHQTFPNVKLIYLMRDPVRRSISHYWHNVRDLEWGAEARPLLEAIKSNSQYIDYSDYAMQIRPYIETFGTDSVYTLTFEELIGNPSLHLKNIFRWLGVRDDVHLTRTEQRWNVMDDSIEQVSGFGILNNIRYSRTWGKLSPILPAFLKGIGNKLAVREVSKDNVDDGEARLYLVEQLKPKVVALSKLLNRNFDEWTSFDNV